MYLIFVCVPEKLEVTFFLYFSSLFSVPPVLLFPLTFFFLNILFLFSCIASSLKLNKVLF